MRVAVFGATGAVGWSVVAALRADPDKRVDAVIGLDRYLPAEPQPHVDWRQVDLEHDELDPHLQGVDAVVNVAWERAGRRDAGMDNVARTRRLLDAVAAASVRHMVQASSFAAYAPVTSPLHDPVDERWPTEGVADVPFAREMVSLERALDEFEDAHQVVRLVRIRSGVVLGPNVAAELARRFGPLAAHVHAPSRLPLLPGVAGAALPAVHHDDLAAAYRLAVTGSGRGPFNVALDTELDLAKVAAALGARPLAVPSAAVGKAAALVDRLLSTHAASWLELAANAPRLDTSRARHELGWNPIHTLDDALRATMLRH